MIQRYVFALALTAAFAAAQAAQAQAQKPTPSGKALYELRCGMCHQARGFGTLTLARRLGEKAALIEARNDLRPAYVQQVVRRGVGSMPPFTKVELPDEQLSAIAGYLASAK